MRAKPSAAFVALLGALTTLPPMSIDISLPGLPAIASSLHASAGALQWTISVFIFAFGAGQLVLGPLSDRYGRRPVLLGGLTVFTLCGLACALAVQAHALIAFRLLQGLGACAGTVCAQAIVHDVARDRRESTTLLGYMSALNAVAPMIAPLIGAAILAVADWRWLFGALAIGGALLVVAVAVAVPETSPRLSGNPVAAYNRALRLPRLGGLAGYVFCLFGGYFALISGSPFALIKELHVSTPLFAVLFAMNAAAGLTGSFVTTRLVRRFDPELVLHFGAMAAVAVGLATLAVDLVWPSPAGFTVTMTLLAYTFGSTYPVVISTALADAGPDGGLVAGLLGAAMTVGGGLGSAISGALPWATTTSVAVVVGVTAPLSFLSYLRSIRRA